MEESSFLKRSSISPNITHPFLNVLYVFTPSSTLWKIQEKKKQYAGPLRVKSLVYGRK